MFFVLGKSKIVFRKSKGIVEWANVRFLGTESKKKETFHLISRAFYFRI